MTPSIMIIKEVNKSQKVNKSSIFIMSKKLKITILTMKRETLSKTLKGHTLKKVGLAK
jgi:hypothetical protein